MVVMPALPYDPDFPPMMMPPPFASRTTSPPPPPPSPYAPRFAPPPYALGFAPPYAPGFAPPLKFARVPQLDGLQTWCADPFDTIVKYGSREKRKTAALIFKDFCTSRHRHNMEIFKDFKDFSTSHHNKDNVRKAWIGGRTIDCCLGKSLGIMWIALHGVDSICAVIRNKDLVHLEQVVSPRVGELDIKNFLTSFWNVIISEVEDNEDHYGEALKDSLNSSVKPFGVVNEVKKVSGHEASSVEYDEEVFVQFLQEEIDNASTFTFDKTVMTAISAFQHLFCQKFEADEIRVFAWKKSCVIGKELLQEREDPDVEELLACLDGPENDPVFFSVSLDQSLLLCGGDVQFPKNPLKPSSGMEYNGCGSRLCEPYPSLSKLQLPTATLRRRTQAILFKGSVQLVRNKESIEEGKAYISSDGPGTLNPHLWNEILYGIPRIAVHGIDSICVVTRKEDVVSLIHRVRQAEDPTRLCMSNEESSIQYFHHKFKNAVIYEVEELAVPCFESFEKLQRHPNKPFSVVSWNLSNKGGHKVSVEQATWFLRNKMKSGTAFTFIETVKTAINALQHLFGKKLKANEIEVFVLKEEGSVRKFSRKELGTLSFAEMLDYHEIKEMPNHADRSIKDYLNLINKA